VQGKTRLSIHQVLPQEYNRRKRKKAEGFMEFQSIGPQTDIMMLKCKQKIHTLLEDQKVNT